MSSSWQMEELRRVGVSVLDCEHKTPPDAGIGYPYIAIPNLVDGRLVLDNVRRISREDYLSWTRRTKPQPGDIIVTRRGRVGDTAVVPAGIECAIGQNLVILRSDNSIVDQRYLRWACRGPLWESEVDRILNVGAVFSSLNVREIPKIRIPVPPLKDQRAIASLLEALDDKIAVNERIASTAESLSITLASEDLWNVRIPLGDLAEHVKEQVALTSIEAARVAHYSLPAFDQGRLPEITDPGEIKSAKFRVSAAAVLLSKLNPGTPRVWNVEPDPGLPALASTEFLVLRPKFGIHPSELWAVCNQAGFRDDVANKATGTSNSHQRARPADILASHVVDPRSMRTSSREQIVSLCARAKLARIESQKLADLRDALLPGLMLGAIQVRDAEKAVEEAT